MAEPRRPWDRARERVERALEHLRHPDPRMATSATDELARALEDLAGTERAVAPVYVVVHDRTGEHRIRGVYTTRDAASDASAGERWVDVEEGVGRLMETGHRTCCSIEEWLVLDQPPDIGDARIRPHQHAWIQVTDADGNTGRHCRLPGCHAPAPAVG